MLLEYGLIFCIIAGSWVISIQHFRNDMHLLNKIRSETLTSNDNAFNYESGSTAAGLANATQPSEGKIAVFVEQGDNPRALAHKAVNKYLAEHFGNPIEGEARWLIDSWLMDRIPSMVLYPPNTIMPVSEELVEQAIDYANTQLALEGQHG